jgi:transcriptional regulator GlxA family with amidase domain
MKELDGVKKMIQQASKGINIYGSTRDEIAKMLITLSSENGFEKVDGLLQIMHLISTTMEKKFILSEDAVVGSCQSDRMKEVVEYIQANLDEQITLKHVADVACLTVPSFCRFFKKRTNMTFFQFLTNLRIAYACKLLIERDKSISTIANMCGYSSDSHFCKVFKDHLGQSPLQYRCGVSEDFKK